MSDLSPLSRVKRKLDFWAVRSAFDPHRTLAARAKALLAHHKLRNQCVLAALAAENKQSEENAEFASVKIGLIPSDLARPE